MAILSIHRQPSRRLVVILSLVHLAAAGLLWPLALSWDIKVVISAALIISWIYYLRQDALLIANNAVVALELSDEMQCTLITHSGKSIACTVLGSTFAAPYLTVLNLKLAGKFFMCSVVILPDSMDTEQFRQLQVWLRWKWRE
ncbi:MAG: hypothetical protein KA524_09465 [Nitrosomonas sp.]|nr:hypothetical protein [Nitrosomonas sp.]MBP6076587.1 hypothetical protein [Nitrosomonas sp.]